LREIIHIIKLRGNEVIDKRDKSKWIQQCFTNTITPLMDINGTKGRIQIPEHIETVIELARVHDHALKVRQTN